MKKRITNISYKKFIKFFNNPVKENSEYKVIGKFRWSNFIATLAFILTFFTASFQIKSYYESADVTNKLFNYLHSIDTSSTGLRKNVDSISKKVSDFSFEIDKVSNSLRNLDSISTIQYTNESAEISKKPILKITYETDFNNKSNTIVKWFTIRNLGNSWANLTCIEFKGAVKDIIPFQNNEFFIPPNSERPFYYSFEIFGNTNVLNVNYRIDWNSQYIGGSTKGNKIYKK